MSGFVIDVEKLKEWKENLEFDQYGIDHILEILMTVTAGLHAVGRAAQKLEPGEEDLINGDLTRELHKATEAFWWIKGYVAGAGHSWESCPFGAEHIEALRKARVNLWEFIKETCQS